MLKYLAILSLLPSMDADHTIPAMYVNEVGAEVTLATHVMAVTGTEELFALLEPRRTCKLEGRGCMATLLSAQPDGVMLGRPAPLWLLDSWEHQRAVHFKAQRRRE